MVSLDDVVFFICFLLVRAYLVFDVEKRMQLEVCVVGSHDRSRGRGRLVLSCEVALWVRGEQFKRSKYAWAAREDLCLVCLTSMTQSVGPKVLVLGLF